MLVPLLLAVAAGAWWLLVGDPVVGRMAEQPDYSRLKRIGLSTYALVLLVALCLSVVMWGVVVLAAWPFWLGMVALAVVPWLAADVRHRFLRWRGDFAARRGMGSAAGGAARNRDLEAVLRQLAEQGQQARPGSWYGDLGNLGVTLSDGSRWGVDDGGYVVSPPSEDSGDGGQDGAGAGEA